MALLIEMLQRLDLGIQGENLARTIEIDCNAWLRMFENGTVSIYHQRNGDEGISVTGASFDRDTGILSWQPSSYDTFYNGMGQAEIRLTEGSVIKKARTVNTLVWPAIVNDQGETQSSNWQAYINVVEGYKNAAQTSELNAEESAEDSEAWAVGERGGVEVTDEDETYENNSKYYADEAGSSATEADERAEDSEAWAIGKRNGIDVISGDETYENNSKYYAGEADDSADAAAASESNAEAWAVGKRGGSDVTSSDTTYHNNAKYYSQLSDEESVDSEAWAKGTRNGAAVGSTDETYQNNSKYYMEKAREAAGAAGDVEETLVQHADRLEDLEEKYTSDILQIQYGGTGSSTFDSAPMEGSSKPVTSGGVHTALAGKQDTLTFDSAPADRSSNPVTSGGVYNAVNTLAGTVSDSVSALEGAIAIVATGSTAPREITSGQYVMWQGALYKASTAIASGETLSNSNLTAVSDGGMNELSSNITKLNSKLTTEILPVVADNVGEISSTSKRIGKIAYINFTITTTSTLSGYEKLATVQGFTFLTGASGNIYWASSAKPIGLSVYMPGGTNEIRICGDANLQAGLYGIQGFAILA